MFYNSVTEGTDGSPAPKQPRYPSNPRDEQRLGGEDGGGVAPGDIITQPDKKIVYNAPFSEKNVYNVRLTNNGAHRIAWLVTTYGHHHRLMPACGVLDTKEEQMLTISCEPFDYGSEDTNNDRISFEWTNIPEGAAKQLDLQWFLQGGAVRRKDLPILYNP